MIRSLPRVVLLAVLCLLSGCDAQRLEPLGPGDRILAFGDSLTSGVGVESRYSYPSVLAELTGLEVINAGVSGETTAEGLARLGRELDRAAPALLILIEGGNDILRNSSTSALKENLRAMIELARDRQVPVVLIGVPQKKLFSNAAPLYGELAEEYELVFDGALLGGLLRCPGLKSDAVHFNRDGYRAMAEAIHELLLDNGALTYTGG